MVVTPDALAGRLCGHPAPVVCTTLDDPATTWDCSGCGQRLTADLDGIRAAEARGRPWAIDALRAESERVWTSPGPPEAAVMSLRLEKSAEFLEASAQTAIRSGESTDDDR